MAEPLLSLFLYQIGTVQMCDNIHHKAIGDQASYTSMLYIIRKNYKKCEMFSNISCTNIDIDITSPFCFCSLKYGKCWYTYFPKTFSQITSLLFLAPVCIHVSIVADGL